MRDKQNEEWKRRKKCWESIKEKKREGRGKEKKTSDEKETVRKGLQESEKIEEERDVKDERERDR